MIKKLGVGMVGVAKLEPLIVKREVEGEGECIGSTLKLQ